MARTLSEVIADSLPVEGKLPLVHIADAFHLEDILTSASLLPTRCDVFEEDLLYFFYGRPAYKTRREENANLLFDFPIVFALHPGAAPLVRERAFPVDTGAFKKGLYANYFHKKTDFDSLEIPSDDESIRKYVGTFYSDNLDYYVGRSTKNVEIGSTEFTLQGLHELARLPTSPNIQGRVSYDERSSSVELQFASEMSLKGNVLAVILPGVFLGEKSIKDKIIEINPKHLETYDTMHGMGPQGVAAIVYDRLLTVYRREELVP